MDDGMITLDALSRDPAIRHAFFTRRGGVSEGMFASLNCGFGSADDPDRVTRNRGIAAGRLGLAEDRLVTCYQVHSATVVTVDEPWRREQSPRADGMVTTRPGIALGVLAADCAPVLFADFAAGVIGAAHGGWRGALTGVLEATAARMAELGASPARIRAGIGPCIAQASYEVGPEFPGRFAEIDDASAAFFVPAARDGHFRFDLPGYIEHRLARLGLAAIERAPHDTVADPANFFSYRRACLAGERDYGRGLAAIALSG
jgi:polyphenol oxidase